MRRLCAELLDELTLPAPARPADLCTALCDAMSRRRGRPVRFRTAAFPPGTASGLWLDMHDQDLILVEERTAPDHQLVILGHELWHMQAGHGGHDVDGAHVAARLLDEGADLRTVVHRAA
ncbi:toxin-antitoxin system, toxin component, partial [Streptomyces thermovulgaris]